MAKRLDKESEVLGMGGTPDEAIGNLLRAAIFYGEEKGIDIIYITKTDLVN